MRRNAKVWKESLAAERDACSSGETASPQKRQQLRVASGGRFARRCLKKLPTECRPECFTGEEKKWTPFQRQLGVEEGVSQKEPVCSGRLLTGKKGPGPERTSGSVDYSDLGLKRLVGRWTI